MGRPIDLEQAALQAARAADHRVEYRLETATRRGKLVYAVSGDRLSWRWEQGSTPQRSRYGLSPGSESFYFLETSQDTVFCILEERWQCFEGDGNSGAPESGADSSPAVFDRRSFQFLAAAARSISPESYKRSDGSFAGYEASCFDIVPQLQIFVGGPESSGEDEAIPPLAPLEGVDPSTLKAMQNALVTEVLYRGGTLCFGSGLLLKMTILNTELFTISAESVSGPDESDFTPPAVAQTVGPPSPFPSVMEAP